MLRNGVPHIRLYNSDDQKDEMKPAAADSADDQLNFADSEWHTMKLVCGAGVGK